ncbi:MAG TPA: inositol monophosphatase family protein [Candidatus Hydrogenedentes bacterium]|nr:inositol monophosphatase family protein [Candidatus Hydrogenedentota bacterium]
MAQAKSSPKKKPGRPAKSAAKKSGRQTAAKKPVKAAAKPKAAKARPAPPKKAPSKKTPTGAVAQKAAPDKPALKKEAVGKPAERHPAKPVEKKSVAVSAAPPSSKPAALPAAEPARSRVKILPREFLMALATTIKNSIAPMIKEARGREIVGSAVSGDSTFEVDRVAEKALLTFLKNARIPLAYYSEDSGYTTFTNAQPQNLLLVDPIDGTRAAKSGFEGCVISIATTRVIERPCMADVDSALVLELMGDRVFYAERGKGARVVQGDHIKRPKLSKNTSLEMLAWAMTVPARPAELIFQTAAKLVDVSSLKGGFFACNSTSFSLTRLVTNQLDACVDFANRYYRDIPQLVHDKFINAGRGNVIGVEPYDLAAGLLIAQEAGAIVTDAYGRDFNDVLLLDSSVDNQRSVIAAANAELHEKLLRFFDTRINQCEQLLKMSAGGGN